MEEIFLYSSLIGTLFHPQRKEQSKGNVIEEIKFEISVLEGFDLFGQFGKCGIIFRIGLEEKIQITK